jgi:hypothetical protein
MEKIFSVALRNDRDWRNFKNVQKHLNAGTVDEIQICFELSFDRYLEMSFDDKENHCAQELLAHLSNEQLDLLFPVFFDQYSLERIIIHPRANHVVREHTELLLRCRGMAFFSLTPTCPSFFFLLRFDRIFSIPGTKIHETFVPLCIGTSHASIKQ